MPNNPICCTSSISGRCNVAPLAVAFLAQAKPDSLALSPCCPQVAALCLYADAINYGDPAATLECSKVLVPAALLAVSPQAEWAIDEEHMLAISASTYGLGRDIFAEYIY